MRTPLLLLVALGCTPVLPAQLRIGRPVPPVEATRWIRGEGVAWGTEGAPALTLFGLWEPGSEAFLENAAYYAELQRRYADRGLHVAGLLYGDGDPEAPAFADFSLGVDRRSSSARAWLRADPHLLWPVVWLVDEDGDLVWSGGAGHDLAGVIERSLAGRFSAEEQQRRHERLMYLREALSDHQPPEQLEKGLDEALAYDRLDGLAWSLKLALHVERMPDPERALAVAVEAFAALAGHSAPMGLFADRALRTDPHNVALAELASQAMTPLAPLAEGDLRFQLAWLRALQRSGNHRQAGLLSRQLAKEVEARPERLLEFVEVLADAPEAAVNADTARRALELAVQAGEGRGQFLIGARFKFLDRCLGDRKAALAVAEQWMAELGNRSAINNAAWYLMVDEPEKGRFDGLALTLCERLLESRESMDYFELDTTALGVFLGGRRHEQAIELVKAALEKAGGPDAKPAYVERLKRFEAARARGEGR